MLFVDTLDSVENGFSILSFVKAVNKLSSKRQDYKRKKHRSCTYLQEQSSDRFRCNHTESATKSIPQFNRKDARFVSRTGNNVSTDENASIIDKPPIAHKLCGKRANQVHRQLEICQSDVSPEKNRIRKECVSEAQAAAGSDTSDKYRNNNIAETQAGTGRKTSYNEVKNKIRTVQRFESCPRTQCRNSRPVTVLSGNPLTLVHDSNVQQQLNKQPIVVSYIPFSSTDNNVIKSTCTFQHTKSSILSSHTIAINTAELRQSQAHPCESSVQSRLAKFEINPGTVMSDQAPSLSCCQSPSQQSLKSTMSSRSDDDVLVCEICLEYYNDGMRVPKFLACFHSFCQPCLQQMAAQNQESVECPKCRKTMQLPAGGVSSLQNNFYVNHMQDLLLKMGAPKTKGCTRHFNQPKSFFCRTCQTAICRDCIVLDHTADKGHKVQDLKVAEAEQRAELRTKAERARAELHAMQRRLTTIDTEIASLNSAKDAALKEIDTAFKNYQQILEDRKNEAIRKVLEEFTQKQTDLEKYSEKLNQFLSGLVTTLSNCEKVSHKGSLGDVVGIKNTICSATEELQLMQKEMIIGQNYLRYDSSFKFNDFENIVQDLGNLTCSSGQLPSWVHYEYGDIVASIPGEITMSVYGHDREVKLAGYPIDIAIYDSTDVVIPSVLDLRGCEYVISFLPQMSGKHRFVPLFLGQPIKGGDAIIHVKPNNPVMKIGGLGSGEGKFCCPRAISCDREGSLYVADTGNKLIQKFTKDGAFMYQFAISAGTEDCSTCDLALDHQKDVIVCTETLVGSSVNPTLGNTVAVYTTSGELKQKFSNKVMKCALCVATNSMSEIIISDYLVHSLFMYDQHGNFIRRIGNANAFNHPAFICIGENNSVIVSDTNNDVVQVFDRQGRFLHQFGWSGNDKGALKQPFGVSDDGENILVVDSGNRRIQVFRRDGTFVSMIESSDDPLNQPRGMVVTQDGHVWVADRDSNCIKKYRYK